MNFTSPYLLDAMLCWGYFYFAGVDGVEGMAGQRLYDWLLLATARAQIRDESL